jgi:hydroxyacylglutathione hydrolase
VDLRARKAFAAGHLAGTLSFDLDGSFATYLGWLFPWGTPLTLLGQTPDEVAAAQRELTRIGIERPAAMAVGDPAGWSGGQPLRSFATADFSDLEAIREHRPLVVLDVRRDQEWADSRIEGAIHIPLHELPGRLAEVPDEELWVYCRTGYRASVAASILDAAGRRVVVIDDDYDQAVSPAFGRRHRTRTTGRPVPHRARRHQAVAGHGPAAGRDQRLGREPGAADPDRRRRRR